METLSDNPIPSRRRSLVLRAAAVGLCTLVLLLATSPGLPIVWDEGNAIHRAQRLTDWTRSWFQQDAPKINSTRQLGPRLPHHDATGQQAEEAFPHPLSRFAMFVGWPYTTQIEGHPAFYGIVIAAGHALGSRILTPVTAWRLGPIMLFALAAGAMFYRMSRLYGRPAGWAAASALLLQPRLFAHAHFATCDGPLTACWILAWAAFPQRNPTHQQGRGIPHLTHPAPEQEHTDSACQPGNPARERGQEILHPIAPKFQPVYDILSSILFGVLLGMTMSTKATGWIAPIPFILWASLYRDRRATLILVFGLPTALATFCLLNPPLWHEPFQGLVTFVHLNTNRQLNVANLFLGRMYDLHHSLPWYNTLVWTAVAVPIALLILAVIGLVSILRHGLADRPGILLILNWVILLIVRALPGAPPHDGIRLFLPAFAFLGALIAVGAVGVQASACRARSLLAHLVSKCAACSPSSVLTRPVSVDRGKTTTDTTSNRATACSPSSVFIPATIILIFLGSASSLFCYAPQWLSYYSLAIGGLPGAARAGMEPTYYWDSLDREVLAWLATNTAEDEKVFFGSGSVESLILMRSWATLPVECDPDAPGRYRWYVIQRRPSACMPPDQWLLQNAEPVYKKYLPSYGPGPWHMNVPLLEIYRYDDYLVAVASCHRPNYHPNPASGLLPISSSAGGGSCSTTRDARVRR